jgi:hypothetical protein
MVYIIDMQTDFNPIIVQMTPAVKSPSLSVKAKLWGNKVLKQRNFCFRPENAVFPGNQGG